MRRTTEEDLVMARLALEKPDEKQAEELATALAAMGFLIKGTSPRGVHFAGPSSLFESVFKSAARATAHGFTFDREPELPEPIAQVKASVYLPTKPEFFP
jgi:hypothetical protein